MMHRTIPRPVSRVLVMDAADRVLLFHSVLSYGTFWLTPGGGLEPGESFEEAAIRELWEETGISIADPGPCIWTCRFSFVHEGDSYDQPERYYLHRTKSASLSTDHWQEAERKEIVEYRWWSLPEIAASTERFRPRLLARLGADLRQQGLPEMPLTVEA